MGRLEDGGEWLAALDEKSGLKLLVLGYPGYFDFHLLGRDDSQVASLYGYSQRLTLVCSSEGQGGRIEVGGASLYLPSDALVVELATRLGLAIRRETP